MQIAISLFLILICVGGQHLYFRQAIKKAKLSKSPEVRLLEDITSISFEGSTLENSCNEVIYSLQSHFNFSYITIFLYGNESNSFSPIASNCHLKDLDELSTYVARLYHENKKPMIHVDKDGLLLQYPTSTNKDICSNYFIPLMVEENCFGAILIEDKRSNAFESIEESFFLTIVNNVSFVIRNISYSEYMKKSSERDSLTGMFNRHYMNSRMPKYVELAVLESSTFCLTILDIDHFKKFNDTYGHQHGDIVLKEVSKYLNSSLRQGDELYRYGGEEFVIYSPGLALDIAQSYYERLRAGVEDLEIETVDTKEITKVTISLGVASYPLHETNHELLLKQADQALYTSKENGRNQITIYSQDCSDKELPAFKKDNPALTNDNNTEKSSDSESNTALNENTPEPTVTNIPTQTNQDNVIISPNVDEDICAEEMNVSEDSEIKIDLIPSTNENMKNVSDSAEEVNIDSKLKDSSIIPSSKDNETIAVKSSVVRFADMIASSSSNE